MSYATIEECFQRYPVLEKWRDNSETSVSSSLLYFSEAEIDSRLSVAFDTPFGSPPPITVKDLTIDLTYCKAMEMRNDDSASMICKRVDKKIKDLIKGDAGIITDSGTILETEGGVEVWQVNGEYPPTFSMLDAESPYSEVSSARIESEVDERK